MSSEQKAAEKSVFDPVVMAAVKSLVRASFISDAALISMPQTYPDGTGVGIRVDPAPGGYAVSDFAFGYRQAENYGAERSYAKHAAKLAEQCHAEYAAGHQLRILARPEQLSGAIKLIAAVSREAVYKTFASSPDWDDTELAADLFQRLVGLFGTDHVFAKASKTGASSVQWRVAAKVTIDDRDVIFDAVSPHHASVFSASSKFNDIARLEEKTVSVAVVENKEAMGKWLPLLSQTAIVIEESASDDTLRRLVGTAA
ncbi:hypothetical protein J2W40_001805 [Sphingobium xenophagum]|uniref:DUF1828 domain-containing protein n=1 Tax=Sphingobium xenophagum TaxID=121428 RepID=A0ABU1X1C9_SPHXE|nr:hypothetical protein [Sphingobium xenophagum]MDR7154987.1 hypothetical protein [Sphingobium xenophagum]